MSVHGSKKPSQHSVRPRASLLLRYKFPNPYVNYLTEYLRNPSNRNGNTTRKLFKIAAARWHQLSPEERAPYNDCAEYNKHQMALQRQHTANKLRRQQRLRKVCSNCGHRAGQKPKKAKKPPPPQKSIKRAVTVKKEFRTCTCPTMRRNEGSDRYDQGSRDFNDRSRDCSANDLFESESVASSVSSF